MATFTFNCDPLKDGWIENTGTDWSTVRLATAGTIDSSFNGTAGSGPLDSLNNGTTYGINRVFLSFDTSVIGSSAIVTSATLTAFLENAGDVDATFNLFGGTQALPITNGDYDSFLNTLLATPVNLSTINPPPGGTIIDLNASGLAAINRTGITKFCIRGGLDYGNNPPPSGTNTPWTLWGPTVAIPTMGYLLTVNTGTTTPPNPTSISPTSGPTTGGTAVTINGTDFVSGCTVTIGGVSCTSVVFVSSTQVTAVTGPLASVGAKDVVVTNPDTGTGTLAAAFTYTAVVPHLTSISPSQGPAAGGTIVTLTGIGFSSGGAPPNSVTFGGVAATFAAGQGVINGNQIVCTSPAGTAGSLVGVVVVNPNSAGSSPEIVDFAYTQQATISGSTGSQIIYDFTRKVWYTASVGELTSMCLDPSSGITRVYSLQNITTGGLPDAKLVTVLDESYPGVPVDPNFPGLAQGFLQTFPVDFGNPHSKKQFQFFRMVVNDVTAITAGGGGCVTPWTVYVYVDNANVTTPPILLTLAVNPEPFNPMPFGTIDADTGDNNPATEGNNNIGELIGMISTTSAGPVVGNNIRCDIYYPTGTPFNTPTSGQSSGVPLNLPWSIYKIDVAATLVSQSKVEP